jgi:hypothetical protein
LDELFPAQIRGPAPKDQLIVLDGKQPKHGSGASVLSAVTVPSQHYLGSAVVDQKTNEIPVARELFKRLELEDRFVSLHALHTQDETARAGLGTLGPIILFMQWRGYKRRPNHFTTTDFQSALSEDHHRPALRLALSKYPT